jgi:ribosomal protein L11 methylase PrmA
LAARMIYTAAGNNNNNVNTTMMINVTITMIESYDDIIDKSIADFGCGPGILSIASSVMGGNNITGSKYL